MKSCEILLLLVKSCWIGGFHVKSTWNLPDFMISYDIASPCTLWKLRVFLALSDLKGLKHEICQISLKSIRVKSAGFQFEIRRISCVTKDHLPEMVMRIFFPFLHIHLMRYVKIQNYLFWISILIIYVDTSRLKRIWCIICVKRSPDSNIM